MTQLSFDDADRDLHELAAHVRTIRARYTNAILTDEELHDVVACAIVGGLMDRECGREAHQRAKAERRRGRR